VGVSPPPPQAVRAREETASKRAKKAIERFIGKYSPNRLFLSKERIDLMVNPLLFIPVSPGHNWPNHRLILNPEWIIA